MPAEGGCQPAPLTNAPKGKPFSWVLLLVVFCEAKQTINQLEPRGVQAVLESDEQDYAAPVQKEFAWLMERDPGGQCHMCRLLGAAVRAVAPHLPVRKARFRKQVRLRRKSGPVTFRAVHRTANKRRTAAVASAAKAASQVRSTRGHPSQGALGQQPGLHAQLAVAPEEAARAAPKAKSRGERLSQGQPHQHTQPSPSIALPVQNLHRPQTQLPATNPTKSNSTPKPGTDLWIPTRNGTTGCN